MKVGDTSVPVAPCNNVYVFPGLGLAVIAVRGHPDHRRHDDRAAAAICGAATILHDERGICCQPG